MTHAVVLLSLVAVAVAEAPYSLPRPSPQQQALQYPTTPGSRPQHHQNHHSAAQTSSGYHYQPPSIGPAFVQVPSQPNYPQSQPQYQLPVSQPNYNPAQSIYQQPQPQPTPQQYYPPAPQPIQQLPPSASYGVPQYPTQPRPTPQPIQTLPAYIYRPQPQPQTQPIQVYQPQPAPQVQVFQPQPQPQQQGYSYPQPLPQSYLRNNALQQPIQLQLFGSSSVSSYQADTNQYNQYQGAQAQTHKDALDATTVHHVQNLIKENEHSSARDAGYLSLVSGVSLENAKPSIELSSFIHNSPSNQGSSSGGLSSVSLSYGLPSVNSNSQTSQSNSLISNNFLPQTQPATSYGIPK